MSANNIFLLLFVSVFVGSCTKLDETILDKPSSDTYIQTEGDVTSAINGIYGLLENGNAFKIEGYNLLTLAADDISAMPNAAFNPYSQKTYDPGVATISWIYTQFFSGVNNCNFLLKKIEELDLNATYKVRAEGEIKFLRAVSYFYLVRMFGGVPLRTEPTDASTNFFVARNTVDQIDSLIFSDLKTASVNLLPKSQLPGNGLGRSNRGAAHAMLSLAYLTYGNYLDRKGDAGKALENYALARDYADSVILSNEYSLMNYHDLWNVDKEKEAYQTEVIWGLKFTRDNVGRLNQSIGSEYALRYMPNTLAGVTGNVATNGAGAGNFRIQPWFYDEYTTGEYLGDYRSEVSFLTTWTHRTNGRTVITYPLVAVTNEVVEQQPYLNKYRDPSGVDNRNHENDLYIIRLSEVYLIKAEAINEISGPTGDAYAAFNMLRERARRADGTPRAVPADLEAGLSKDAFRLKIFTERGLELVGEAHRWFDLVRMKSPTGTTMYEYQFSNRLPTFTAGLPVWNAASKTWGPGRTVAVSLPAYDSRRLLFPIPLRETDMSTLMEQNPGYN